MTGGFVRTATGLKGATIRVRKSGALKDVESGYIRKSGAPKLFYSLGGSGTAFDVNLSPSDVVGYGADFSPVTIFTQASTAMITGGLAPFTYAWTVTAGSGGTWTAETPGAASTTFKCTSVGAATSYDATFTCTVTDARGFSVTAGGTAYVENFGGLYL